MNLKTDNAVTRRGTVMGAAAILLWSTTVAFSRSLTEQLGTYTAAMLIYTAAGLIGLLVAALRTNAITGIRRLPRIYLLGCGALFVTYIVTFTMAIGLSTTREQVLVVGLINYLWPALSLVFSIPLLGRRARPFLPVGILLALVGTWLATTGGRGLSEHVWLQDQASLLPYALAMVAAVCWGLYTNLSRRWAADTDGDAVPLFLLASGLMLAMLRLLTPETSTWSVQSGLELVYMAAFPGMLAYVFWDFAARKGKIILVASLSYLTPLLSTIISALVLNVQPSASLWLGAGLVITGALICKASISEPGYT